jgi:uncharacterized membrane protein
MQHEDVKWRRFFGTVLVAGPAVAALLVLLISGQPESLLLIALILIVPILLGIWLLTRK